MYESKLKHKLADLIGSDKQFWSLIKEIGGLDSERSSAAPDVEALAEHFASKMNNGIDVDDVDFAPDGITQIPLSGFKVRYRMVRSVLKGNDANKSANGVSPKFWKECGDVLAVPVCKLFRLVVNKAIYPPQWKVGRVTPPHKRGAVSVPANYRPLQVLTNISVYFESVLDDQLDTWTMNHTSPCQFGFIKKCGTSDYGSMLSMTFFDVLERRGEGILVSLDVAGAFDRTWWARIKNRLRAKSMKGRAMRLIKDYLYKRYLVVVLGGKASKAREIFSGVPQGAKWSPKLWDIDI